MLKKSKDVLNPQSWCGLNRPDKKETEVDAVIFGIPFDGGVSYRGGGSPACQYEAFHAINRKTILLRQL